MSTPYEQRAIDGLEGFGLTVARGGPGSPPAARPW